MVLRDVLSMIQIKTATSFSSTVNECHPHICAEKVKQDAEKRGAKRSYEGVFPLIVKKTFRTITRHKE